MVVSIAYAAQYECRHFNTALNQRKRNSEDGREFSAMRSLPSELVCMKLFRHQFLSCEKSLIRNELDHRVLSICAHTEDKNIRCEQLKQLRSTLVAPNTPSSGE